jgi:vacuolar-type H+-ATPase subunit I/STV1
MKKMNILTLTTLLLTSTAFARPGDCLQYQMDESRARVEHDQTVEREIGAEIRERNSLQTSLSTANSYSSSISDAFKQLRDIDERFDKISGHEANIERYKEQIANGGNAKKVNKKISKSAKKISERRNDLRKDKRDLQGQLNRLKSGGYLANTTVDVDEKADTSEIFQRVSAARQNLSVETNSYSDRIMDLIRTIDSNPTVNASNERVFDKSVIFSQCTQIERQRSRMFHVRGRLIQCLDNAGEQPTDQDLHDDPQP